MQRIGLLSDTHSFLDPRIFDLFKEVDQIWHAGDIGSGEVLNKIEQFKPTIAVFGNIDDTKLRRRLKQTERFNCEGVDVLLTHIGGFPGKYSPNVQNIIVTNPPNLFICGHSHILKVINDKKNRLLHINPGAAGKYGFHTVRTAVRFTIDVNNIKDLEIIEFEN